MILEKMLSIIDDYKNIIIILPQMIEKRGKMVDDIQKKIGLNDKQWNIKITEQTFTPEELKEIILFIE